MPSCHVVLVLASANSRTCIQQEPHHRRLAFDLGDVGIGQLTNSLELGCDCLGHIHYFDAVLNNSKGWYASQCLHKLMKIQAPDTF